MKKRIFTLTMCLALTATSALANATKSAVQISKNVVNAASVTTPVNAQTNTATITPTVTNESEKHLTMEEARKLKRAEDREKMYNDLGLSDEQRKKAQAIDEKTKKELEPLFKKVHTEVKKLRALKDKKASYFKILHQRFVVKSTKIKIKNKINDSKREFESILTKDQKDKFKQLDDARRKEMQKFKSKCKHCGMKLIDKKKSMPVNKK